MENRETEKKILSEKEMEQAAGGFEYEGVLEWLRGHDICCPKCGNGDAGSITRRYATALHSYYTYEKCGQKFYYTLGLHNKVKVVRE